jgi:hypothetical protein
MPDRENLAGVRAFNDENVHIALNALAERAGELGARKAVHDSFFLLGVDLADKESVDEFRGSMSHMKRLMVASKERQSEFRKSAIGASFSLVAGVIAAVVTTLFLGLSKAATVAGAAASIAQHLPTAH